MASNFSKKNSEISKVKALTYAEHQRLEKLNRLKIYNTNFAKLAPNEKIAAGFSQHFGPLPDMHSTDLESSMVSGSYKNKLEIFGRMAQTTTNKETSSMSNRANLFSDSGENTERVMNL